MNFSQICYFFTPVSNHMERFSLTKHHYTLKNISLFSSNTASFKLLEPRLNIDQGFSIVTKISHLRSKFFLDEIKFFRVFGLV